MRGSEDVGRGDQRPSTIDAPFAGQGDDGIVPVSANGVRLAIAIAETRAIGSATEDCLYTAGGTTRSPCELHEVAKKAQKTKTSARTICMDFSRFRFDLARSRDCQVHVRKNTWKHESRNQRLRSARKRLKLDTGASCPPRHLAITDAPEAIQPPSEAIQSPSEARKPHPKRRRPALAAHQSPWRIHRCAPEPASGAPPFASTAPPTASGAPPRSAGHSKISLSGGTHEA